MAIKREQGKRYGFTAIAEDAEKLSSDMLQHENLCRLLYHNGENAMQRDSLNDNQKEELLDKNYIVFKPKVEVDEDNNVRNIVTTTFDNFSPTSNPLFYSYIMTIDVLCHIDNWFVYNRFNQKNIRPLLIGDYLVDMVDGTKFTGIGRANFIGARSLRLASNPDYVGISLSFDLINSGQE